MNAIEHASADEPREIDSAGLFAGRNEVIIVHKGGRYRLRITRQDKLILNK
jgi:hemin uptake protein HemP